jgi:hypothetical protein
VTLALFGRVSFNYKARSDSKNANRKHTDTRALSTLINARGRIAKFRPILPLCLRKQTEDEWLSYSVAVPLSAVNEFVTPCIAGMLGRMDLKKQLLLNLIEFKGPKPQVTVSRLRPRLNNRTQSKKTS